MRDIRKYITLIESNEKKVKVVESFKDAKTKYTQDEVQNTLLSMSVMWIVT